MQYCGQLEDVQVGSVHVPRMTSLTPTAFTGSQSPFDKQTPPAPQHALVS